MYDFEITRETAASPEALWAVYIDVDGWPAWLTSFDSVRLLGPFASGTECVATYNVDGNVDTHFHLDNVRPLEGYDLIWKVGPLISGRMTHTIERTAAGARFTHALHNGGALAALNVINVAIARATAPAQMERVARLAEASLPGR